MTVADCLYYCNNVGGNGGGQGGVRRETGSGEENPNIYKTTLWNIVWKIITQQNICLRSGDNLGKYSYHLDRVNYVQSKLLSYQDLYCYRFKTTVFWSGIVEILFPTLKNK